MRLAVIDTLWPGNIAELVLHVDALGYSRYWATEHHGPEQSASPEILVALAAGLSHGLRVGSAGVLLSLYSPRKVAADFRLLELLFPGRIDLGVASAVPPEPMRGALLDGRALGRDAFARKAAALAALIRGPAVRDADAGDVRDADAGDAAAVGPRSPSAPAIWVCGTSERSARLAGALGVRYAVHHYQLDQPGMPGNGPAVVAAYRAAFRPSADLAAPEVSVACYGMCADTEAEARAGWADAFADAAPGRSPDGWSGPGVPRPSFLGPPARCREQLDAIADRYGARELAVQAFAPPLSARLSAYGLLAEAFSLPGREHPAP